MSAGKGQGARAALLASIAGAVERELARQFPAYVERVADAVAERLGERPREEVIEQVLDAKRCARFIDSHFSRSEIEARLGTRRSTFHRWRSGQVRKAKIATAETFLRDLGGRPADVAELTGNDRPEAA